jgi:hypothetical protein
VGHFWLAAVGHVSQAVKGGTFPEVFSSVAVEQGSGWPSTAARLAGTGIGRGWSLVVGQRGGRDETGRERGGTDVPLILCRPYGACPSCYAYPGLRPRSGLHPGLFSRRAYGAYVNDAAMLVLWVTVRMGKDCTPHEPFCADVDVPTTAGLETGATRAPA